MASSSKVHFVNDIDLLDITVLGNFCIERKAVRDKMFQNIALCDCSMTPSLPET